MAEWLRTLIFSALSHGCGFEPSQILLAGGQVVFLGDLTFLPHLTIDSAQNEWNNLDRLLNQNKKLKELIGGLHCLPYRRHYGKRASFKFYDNYSNFFQASNFFRLLWYHLFKRLIWSSQAAMMVIVLFFVWFIWFIVLRPCFSWSVTFVIYIITYEPPHDKTNKMSAPSKDSDQPGRPPSLIRVFAVRMKKAWVLSYPLSTQWRLRSHWANAQADLSLWWTHSHFVGFVILWLILWF